jgi:membrane fusion protein (multidrug efflux system)
VAEASVAQATVELAITEQQVARSQVTAPIAGRIARKLADAGAMLVPGAPIYTIVDDAVLELRASVPSADYHKVRIGEAVSVQVDALPGEAVVGEVTRIAPIVDARTRAFDVVVRVPGGSLVTGLFARAEVRVRELPGSLTVPPAALVRDGADPARATAFVVVADSTAERRDVGVGVETSDAVQVTSGLSVGERVVVDPPAALGPGTPVDVQP